MKKLSLLSLAALSIFALAPLTAGAQQAPAPLAQGAGAARAGLVQTQLTDTVTRYVVGPLGRAHGLVLSHGTVVLVHGHANADLATRIPVGTAVRVDGLINPASPQTVYHAAVYSSTGAVLVEPHQRGQGMGPGMGQDQGQGAGPQRGPGAGQRWHGRRAEFRDAMRARVEALPTVRAQGTVQSLLAGPRGHAHGALLSDGSTVMFAHGLSRLVAQHGVRVGDTITAVGHGSEGPQGRGLAATQVTFADGTVLQAPVEPAAPAQQ